MKYKYLLPTFCIFSTISLYAEENGLGDILQKAGEKQALIKPLEKKTKQKKKTRFVFKDVYESNGIGSNDKSDKSESYDYENKSRFKFKFNDGSGHSNLMGISGSAGAAGSMSGGNGGGGGRR